LTDITDKQLAELKLLRKQHRLLLSLDWSFISDHRLASIIEYVTDTDKKIKKVRRK